MHTTVMTPALVVRLKIYVFTMKGQFVNFSYFLFLTYDHQYSNNQQANKLQLSISFKSITFTSMLSIIPEKTMEPPH